MQERNKLCADYETHYECIYHKDKHIRNMFIMKVFYVLPYVILQHDLKYLHFYVYMV